MTETVCPDRWSSLSRSAHRLHGAKSITAAIDILRGAARQIAGADCVTIALREGDYVSFVGDETIAPLWTGKRFPIHECASGLAMLERRTIIIPDVRNDARVPHNAYLSTFVSSMAIFPVGNGEPVVAIAVYWRERRRVDDEAMILLKTLTQSAGATFEHLQVLADAERKRFEFRGAA